MPVVQTGLGLCAEPERHGGHDVALLCRAMLEYGIPVAIPAFIRREFNKNPFQNVIAADCRYYILDLHSVGSDVLHGRSSDFSGYMGEIFQAPKPMNGSPFAQIIENNP